MRPNSRAAAALLSIFAAIGSVRSGVAQTPLDASVARLYAGSSSRAAWLLGTDALSHHAGALLHVVAEAEKAGLVPENYFTPTLDSLLRQRSPADAWRLDSLLTRLFFAYAADVSRGRVDPAAVDTQWTAAPQPINLVALLETAFESGDMRTALQDLEPPQPGYRALRVALARYLYVARGGDWPADLPRRLAAEGYDTTQGVDVALRRFQALHDLPVDGMIGLATRTELDVPAAARARQIALNLERWRWLPRSLGERYILVNGAAFSLQLVENDVVTLTMRAIVGRPDWPTPIVSSTATHLVFRPVWRVPRAIAVQELLPLIRRDPGYLARAGFRVFSDSSPAGREVHPAAIAWTAVSESTFAYQFVQEPGTENPLGGVKLVFWTPFSVFIHDTPARPLFSERWRTFSHGCVRVEGAAALAARLLEVWSDDSIHSAMTNGRQRWVRLPEPVPVHLVYWTAWAMADGLVAFAADPYGWDEELARALNARRAPRVTMK